LISPLVSIIIPAYNAKKFVEETIKSALEQTYDNIEIILVDDGSTDGTDTLFPAFEKQNVQCVKIKNGGASRARNIGLKKAKGEYIQFLDADDILAPDKIQKQIQKLDETKGEVIYCLWSAFETKLPEQPRCRFDQIPHPITQTGKELLVSFGEHNWYMPLFCWLTHKDVIERAGFWNEEISNNDDGEYFARILYTAKTVISQQEILAYYRRTASDSLSTFNSEEKIDAAYKSYQLIEKLIVKDSDRKLRSYPKRMYYIQYRLIKDEFPELAKRAAQSFDKIKAYSFLSRQRVLWRFIKIFGLYKGTIYYELYRRSLKKVRKLLNNKPNLYLLF